MVGYQERDYFRDAAQVCPVALQQYVVMETETWEGPSNYFYQSTCSAIRAL